MSENREDWKPSERQCEERHELLISIRKDDYFAKRKFPSLREAFSGFLLSLLLVGFWTAVSFWRGHIHEVDTTLVLFCLVPATLVGLVSYRYVMGTVWSTVLLLLLVAVSWFLFYGRRFLFA